MLEPNHPLSEEEAIKFRDSYPFWYQRIYLGSGIYTQKDYGYPEKVWDAFRPIFPKKLNGESVLDIGTNAGYHPLEFRSINAGCMVGVESTDYHMKQAEAIKNIYGVEYFDLIQCDAEDFAARQQAYAQYRETFDIVVCAGILYHLKNPFQVIEDMGNLCDDVILVETECIPENPANCIYARQGKPAHLAKTTSGFMKFFVDDSLNGDFTNWWAPDKECLIGMLKQAGFKYFSSTKIFYESRMLLAATKNEKSIVNLSKF